MSRLDRRFCRSTRARGEGGAAAIEFALVFPIFVMLTFGMISAGFAFFYNIQIAQAARDAARFGSTLPMEGEVEDRLAQVAAVAAEQNGWSLPDEFDDDGVVCAAYIEGSNATRRQYPGGTVEAEKCFPDDDATSPDPRVQVLVSRDSEINGVLFSWDLDLRSTTVIPWERRNTDPGST